MFGIPFLTPTLVKWGAIALAFLAMFAWVGVLKLEVNSAKKDAQKWETTYVTYKTNVEGKIAALGSANGALTLQLKQSNIARMEADNKARPIIIQRIANDKAAASIAIPNSSLRVYNDAARSGSADLGQPSGTVRVDAPDTEPSGVSFLDIQQAHETDSHELNLCRKSVIDWNKMWDGFVVNVKATERVTQ
jgi:primosomal replication protein N